MSEYVYICGPVSGMPDHNWPAFNAARSTVKQILGHVMVTIPHELVPSSVSEPLAMGLCLAALCAAVENGMDLTIVALPGWRDSLGSLVEVALARKLGVPVVELVGNELIPTAETGSLSGSVEAGLSDTSPKSGAAGVRCRTEIER